MGVQGENAGAGLDALARDLATGTISRRTALKRFGGLTLGAMLPGALFADSAFAKCPESRRCAGTCCPNHAHCVHGKCKCRKGFTKCGSHCRNLDTDPRNCGSCGHKCPAGESCRNGHCKPAPASCTDGVKNGDETDVDCGGSCSPCANGTNCLVNSDCQSGVCSGGTCAAGPTCGDGIIGPGEQCDDGNQSDGDGCSSTCQIENGWQCNGQPSTCMPICGDGLIVGGEQCDGLNLGGASCQTLGFTGGALACSNDCQSFDVSGCDDACTPDAQRPCGSNVGACQPGTQTCGQNHQWGSCVGGIGPQVEHCNGIDDDCDGVADNGFNLGAACECSPGVPGVTVCAPNGLGVVCKCT